ncbi:methionine gamma-lyase [Ornatilinea apprima]|uniref:homocysteine desulfhydrase n=1 Tax=Ornatilinea apprima TaxID=1134406 RepID=A0A0P6X2X6_9CHLR|nr:PLP-dependent aspartate aminotransferase family protein [Ornatilinea apprima]KPL73753.1 methionine gamma-lyase [Ornatilinea apprima]
METKDKKFATRVVHAGQHPDHETGALVSPMYLTSTFVFTPEKMERYMAGDKEGIYTYGRSRNPTQNMFQEKIASLEGGEMALATASGMAAISTALLGTVHAGDHIIACKTVYGGTHALFTSIFPELNIEVTFLPEMTPAALDAAKRPNTKAVYVETVLNPTLEVLDLQPVFDWARANKVRSFVDNTFTTPYLYRPIEHGADVVLHSTTKYINGHGDHIGGAIVCDAVYHEKLRSSVYQEFGPVPSPFACWLGLRGLKTLHLRMRAHCENAMKLAEWLEQHPKVVSVSYPGLKSHPQHDVAARQFENGFGGMVGFCVEGGIREAQKVINAMQMAYYAVSLGDLDTLVEQPATMTHGKMGPEARKAMGIEDSYIRLSVGVEDVDDIIADIDNALKQI